MSTKTNTTKTNTTTTAVAPVVAIPAGTPRVNWSVKGRGKSATYCAGLPAGTGKAGQAVALVAASGAVTFANLTEVRETADGIARWDFERDTVRNTPAVKAANRAAKALGNAAYWQSDQGLATAQRIADRNEARQAHHEQEAPAEVAPAVAAVVEHHEAPAVDIAAMVAAMLAAGMDGATIGTAVAAASVHHEVPAVAQAPAVATRRTPAPRLPVAKKAAPAVKALGTCEVCGKAPAVTMNGAHTACGKCATLDTDTADIRSKRTAARK